MPELPEVEVVKRYLEKYIIGLKVKKVTINVEKLRYKLFKKDFIKVINKKIFSVERRSKYLLLNLEKKIIILVHLGMTGKFFIVNKDNKKKKTSFYYEITKKDYKHNHIIFYFQEGLKLIYNDVRKFGFIKVIDYKDKKNNSHLNSLGPEPLSEDFNIVYFKKYIKKKNKKIKDLLMDQKFVSGLGNIYVNEILFLAGVYPKKSLIKINLADIARLIKFTKKILKKSILLGGSSIKNFNDSEGKKGNFQQLFNVYGRKNGKCPKKKCNEIITKVTISNRATFYCKRCQK